MTNRCASTSKHIGQLVEPVGRLYLGIEGHEWPSHEPVLIETNSQNLLPLNNAALGVGCVRLLSHLYPGGAGASESPQRSERCGC
jgi:hypothetical protein